MINSMILGTVIIMIMNQFTSGNDGFPFSDKPNRTLLQHSHGCLALDVMFCPNLEPRGHQKKNAFAEYEFYHVSIWKSPSWLQGLQFVALMHLGAFFWKFKTRPKKIRVSELKSGYYLGHLKTCVNSNPKGRRFGARNRKEPLLS